MEPNYKEQCDTAAARHNEDILGFGFNGLNVFTSNIHYKLD